MMLAVLLLVSIPMVFGETANYAVADKGKTIAAYGKEATLFASLIARNTGLEMVSDAYIGPAVVVISDLTGVDMSGLAYALQNKAIVVAINLPVENKLISAPTLQENIAKAVYEINAEDGTSHLASMVQESARTIYPEYWISVIRYDTTFSESSYALVEDTPEKREKISSIAANKVEEMIVASSFPDPGTEWAKKLERNHLWDLAGNDQLYTRHEVFALKYWDEAAQGGTKEYWRTDSYIDHWLPSYVQQTGHCGPYISTRQIVVDGDSSELYDYSPRTTVSDTTVSVSIGFTVTTGGVGVNVGYSWSWTNPGVRYDTSPDYVNSRVTWDETFRGPDYTWWPFYGGPCEASHNSYNAKTTVIMRSPLGSGFNVASLRSRWIAYDDFMALDPWNPFIWWLTRYTYTYTDPWSVGVIPSIFRTVIKIQAWRTTDTYSRSHGLTVDRDLPENWWLLSGYQFLVTSSPFTYTRTVYLLPGSHFVEYSASGYVPNYAWHARIYINDVLIAEGDVGRFSVHHLRGYFNTWWV